MTNRTDVNQPAAMRNQADLNTSKHSIQKLSATAAVKSHQHCQKFKVLVVRSLRLQSIPLHNLCKIWTNMNRIWANLCFWKCPTWLRNPPNHQTPANRYTAIPETTNPPQCAQCAFWHMLVSNRMTGTTRGTRHDAPLSLQTQKNQPKIVVPIISHRLSTRVGMHAAVVPG
jgi:hypothetical protein